MAHRAEPHWQMTFPSSHVPQQSNPVLQTTVNPADLFLIPPSQPYVIPHTNAVSAITGFGGYSAGVVGTDQGGLRHPLTQGTPFAGHGLAQHYVTNNAPAKHLTVPSMPFGRMDSRSVVCKWVSNDMSCCGQIVNEQNVAKHLAEHGIRKMHKYLDVECRWQGCGLPIKRQNISRHFREIHMCLKRRPPRHHILEGLLHSWGWGGF